MGQIIFILAASAASIFNIYMWYYELRHKKIFQFILDLGGTLIIIILFSAASETLSGFAISMIVSATWSIIAMIENKKRSKEREKKRLYKQFLKANKIRG